MSRYELASFVSGRIARTNPLEGGPELEATLNGSNVIKTTWGHYATRLMDLRGCEPHEAVALLRLSPDDLADPTVQFQNVYGFGNYAAHMIEIFQAESQKDLMVEVRRLHGIVDTVMGGYVLPDPVAASEQAAGIQHEINEDMRREQDEGREKDHALQMARCMERDALHSGVRIPLDEFITIMLSTNVIHPEYGSELGQQWVESLVNAVEEFWRDHVKPDLPIGRMVAGKEIFTNMKIELTHSLYGVTNNYALEKWAEIEPVFLARDIQDVPLINGSDAS